MTICIIIAVGIAATLWTDLINWLRRRLLGSNVPDYASFGRWVCHMSKGVFVHTSIQQADKMPAEGLVGWCLHYLIGIVFAAGLVLWQGMGWLSDPSLAPALAVGLATVIFPFFIMQPAFGAGVAASRTPNPAKARWSSLVNHGLFGVGLYLAALISTIVI